MKNFKNLYIEDDESEHDRVLEYLAFARYAVQIALAGARSTGPENFILKRLPQLATEVDFQVRLVIHRHDEDTKAVGKINQKLNQCFTTRLSLDEVPPP